MQTVLWLLFIGSVLLWGLYYFLQRLSKRYNAHKAHFVNLYLTDAEDQPIDICSPNRNTTPVYLSVVVPAYNEEVRIGKMLDETIQYLDQERHLRAQQSPDNDYYKYEIIVVDDGSKDNTVHCVKNYIQQYGSDKIKLLKLPVNSGKGAAVKNGALKAQGKYVLMADADGATDIRDLNQLESALLSIATTDKFSHRYGIAMGSRAHLQKETIVQRKWYRKILSAGFHFGMTYILGSRIKAAPLGQSFDSRNMRDTEAEYIRDTQCGFKLFTNSAAKACFAPLHIDRWAFDVEVLVIAQKLEIPMCEIPVHWEDVEGSKMNLASDSIAMAKDLLLIKLFYLLGFWKIMKTSDSKYTA